MYVRGYLQGSENGRVVTIVIEWGKFGPKKKSSPIYLGQKILDTFWCTGWAWNCQIIFRFASIRSRAGFILILIINGTKIKSKIVYADVKKTT
jgi:hypothetical protein